MFLAVGNAELGRELRGRLGAHVSSTPHGIKMPFHLNDKGRCYLHFFILLVGKLARPVFKELFNWL